MWQRPAADFLAAPLALLPLAPLADVRPPDLPGVVSAMRSRIDGQPDRPLAAKLWAASYVLMGLRYDPALTDNVLSGVMQMEESTTYQAILKRGSTAEARTMLLRQGRKKFGPVSAAQEAALTAITDLARLEALGEKLLDVTSWEELLKDS